MTRTKIDYIGGEGRYSQRIEFEEHFCDRCGRPAEYYDPETDEDY